MPLSVQLPKDVLERPARMYRTNVDAARALGVSTPGFIRACRREGVETPGERTKRMRKEAC